MHEVNLWQQVTTFHETSTSSTIHSFEHSFISHG